MSASAEPRYCPNCRAEIPARADVCPGCGTFAGDLFDGRLPRRPGRGKWVIAFLVVMLAVAAAGWLVLTREPVPAEPAPVRVVGDRPGGARRAPGATINEAEAIRLLRRHLVETGLSIDCLVIKSEGPAGGRYALTAFNRCDNTRLGRWSVDGRTGEVLRP